MANRWGKGRGGRPWRRLRESVLQRDRYICQPCLHKGRYTEAQEVDHIVPISKDGSDDPSNLQSICKPCHAAKTACEGGPASNHPAWLPLPSCKVVLITGPAGAGKTTWAKAKAGPQDEVIDLDECFREVCGIHGHEAPREYLDAAIRLRNHKLADLKAKTTGIAYFICSCPTDTEVAWWQTKLQAEHVRIDPGYSVTMSQVAKHRRHIAEAWYEAQGGTRQMRQTRMERRQMLGDHWSR